MKLKILILTAAIFTLSSFSASAAWNYKIVSLPEKQFRGTHDGFIIMSNGNDFCVYRSDGTNYFNYKNYNAYKSFIDGHTLPAASAKPTSTPAPAGETHIPADDEAVGFVKDANQKYAAVNRNGALLSGYIYDRIEHSFNMGETNPHTVRYPFETPHGNISYRECTVSGSQVYAYVRIGSKSMLIDTHLNEIDIYSTPFYAYKRKINERYDLLFLSSDIDPEYNNPYAVFDNQESKVSFYIPDEMILKDISGSRAILRKKDSKYDCIITDMSGNTLARFESGVSFLGDCFLSFRDKNTALNGIADINGKCILPPQYGIIYSRKGCFIVNSNDYSKPSAVSMSAYRVIDANGENVFGNTFRSVDYASFDSKTFVVRDQDGNFKILIPDEHYTAVRINGEPLIAEQPAVIRSGRTLVPMREITEALGGTAEWNGDTKTASAQFGDTKIEFTAGSDTFTVNGETLALDAPAAIVNDRVMLPVRSLAEAVGAQVDFNDAAKCVYIDTAQ